MRMLVFARRNAKEILRDPVNLGFGLGFPLALLLLLWAIDRNVPVSIMPIQRLAPGISMFGLSFISLFSATLISRDRSSSFLARLFSSPLTAGDFILGYTLPLLPMCVIQSALCYLLALVLGLEAGWELLGAMAVLLPADLFFIGVGLLCGSVFSDKQVGGVCGALLTNMAALLSGTWFDVEMVGGWYASLARALPFVHAVDAGRAALAGDWTAVWPHLLWVAGYAAVFLTAAIAVFRKKMRQG